MAIKKDPLLAEVEAFLGHHGMSVTRFGTLAVKDAHFVQDLRKGRGLLPATRDRVVKFMACSLPPVTDKPKRKKRKST